MGLRLAHKHRTRTRGIVLPRHSHQVADDPKLHRGRQRREIGLVSRFTGGGTRNDDWVTRRLGRQRLVADNQRAGRQVADPLVA